MKWIELAASGDVPQVTSGLGRPLTGFSSTQAAQLCRHAHAVAVGGERLRAPLTGGSSRGRHRLAAHRSPPGAARRLTLRMQARSSHSLTAIGDTLYLWGGEHAPRVPLGGDLYAYSLAQQTWRKVAVQGEPPSLRNAHAAAALGSDLYIFGGRSLGEGHHAATEW